MTPRDESSNALKITAIPVTDFADGFYLPWSDDHLRTTKGTAVDQRQTQRG